MNNKPIAITGRMPLTTNSKSLDQQDDSQLNNNLDIARPNFTTENILIEMKED